MKKFLIYLIPIFIVLLTVIIIIRFNQTEELDTVQENIILEENSITNYGITLKYLEYDSKKVIAKNEDIFFQINETYDLNNLQKKIENYTFYKVDGPVKGITNSSKINIIFYYTKAQRKSINSTSWLFIRFKV